MTNAKLVKVNHRLYHEPYKDGKPFKWAKNLSSLTLKLAAIRVGLNLHIDRPETFSRQLFADLYVGTEEEEHAEGEENPTGYGSAIDDKYSESMGWRLTAIGILEDRRFGLIPKDGATTYRKQEVEITLNSIADNEKERNHGSLVYIDGELLRYESRTDPYYSLELPVPGAALDQLCREFLNGRLQEIRLGVYVDVFQSEVEMSLAEPWMRQDCYVAEGGNSVAYLDWIMAQQATKDEIEQTKHVSNDEIEQTNDASEDTDDNVQANRPNDTQRLESVLREMAQSINNLRITGIFVAVAIFMLLLK